ncbi:MAG: hypothetical protein GX173_10335, partial [Ruminococcaceae bacterium]|nr:hypothetical protein [Oscillospiraceae bacterium]
ETFVSKPDQERLRTIAKTISVISGVQVALMTHDEEAGDFVFGDEVIIDLLKTIAVHPIREDVIQILIKERGFDATVLDWLIRHNLIIATTYEGRRYYRKNIQKGSP